MPLPCSLLPTRMESWTPWRRLVMSLFVCYFTGWFYSCRMMRGILPLSNNFFGRTWRAFHPPWTLTLALAPSSWTPPSRSWFHHNLSLLCHIPLSRRLFFLLLSLSHPSVKTINNLHPSHSLKSSPYAQHWNLFLATSSWRELPELLPASRFQTWARTFWKLWPRITGWQFDLKHFTFRFKQHLLTKSGYFSSLGWASPRPWLPPSTPWWPRTGARLSALSPPPRYHFTWRK